MEQLEFGKSLDDAEVEGRTADAAAREGKPDESRFVRRLLRLRIERGCGCLELGWARARDLVDFDLQLLVESCVRAAVERLPGIVVDNPRRRTEPLALLNFASTEPAERFLRRWVEDAVQQPDVIPGELELKLERGDFVG